MPDNNRLVNSGYPVLPFYVNDHGLDSLFSITIVSTSGALEAGTVLGKITASGKYHVYNDSHGDGTEVARGILFNRVEAPSGLGGGDVLASMMVMGVVRSGSLFGYDANAATDLKLFRFV